MNAEWKKVSSVSENVDKICRTIYYQVKKAKNLKEAANAVKVLIGPENVAAVHVQLEEEAAEKE